MLESYAAVGVGSLDLDLHQGGARGPMREATVISAPATLLYRALLLGPHPNPAGASARQG